MDRKELKNRLERILEYEGRIVDEWENGLSEAQIMVKKAVEEHPNNKWLEELRSKVESAFEMEKAVSDVKGFLEMVKVPSISDEDLKRYKRKVSGSIDMCDCIAAAIYEDRTKRESEEKELLDSFKELNLK
ncbi:hypothetical protein ES705_16503 [subsurface metagenome]|nr:hypothetical protein [Methanosarcinales archaeon]